MTWFVFPNLKLAPESIKTGLPSLRFDNEISWNKKKKCPATVRLSPSTAQRRRRLAPLCHIQTDVSHAKTSAPGATDRLEIADQVKRVSHVYTDWYCIRQSFSFFTRLVSIFIVFLSKKCGKEGNLSFFFTGRPSFPGWHFYFCRRPVQVGSIRVVSLSLFPLFLWHSPKSTRRATKWQETLQKCLSILFFSKKKWQIRANDRNFDAMEWMEYANERKWNCIGRNGLQSEANRITNG